MFWFVLYLILFQRRYKKIIPLNKIHNEINKEINMFKSIYIFASYSLQVIQLKTKFNKSKSRPIAPKMQSLCCLQNSVVSQRQTVASSQTANKIFPSGVNAN